MRTHTRVKLIGFIGLPGSGKSTALEVLENKAPIVVMGGIVREEAKKRKLPITGKNLGNIAKNLREELGPNAIAIKTAEKIRRIASETPQNNSPILIDGLRSVAEYDYFSKFWEIKLVYVECPQKLRYQRMLDRKREDDSPEIAQLKTRDAREIKFGLLELKDHADAIIHNESSLETLKTRILEVFIELTT